MLQGGKDSGLMQNSKESYLHYLNHKLDHGNGHNVLVTGGAGFVGSNLCRVLLDLGYEVYAVDNLITGKVKNIAPLMENKRFYFLNLDIVDHAFRRMFKEIKISRIFHLACPTGVPNIKILGEEMILTNSVGTLNVMELARRHKAKVLFSSSAEVYGQPEKSPQDEKYTGNVDPLGPRSAYEEGKRFSESIVKLYAKNFAVKAFIVRIFNTYGPGMSLEDQRVMPQFLKSLLNDQKINVYGDGEQTRTFLYVDDLIAGLLLVMEKGQSGEAYNIGGDKQVRIKELADLMKQLTRKNNGVQYTPHFIEDHKSRQPSVTKVSGLGWEQKIPLDEGLNRMIRANGFKIEK